VRRATAPSGDEQDEQNEQDEQDAADLLYTAVYDAAGTAISDAWSTRFDELVAFYEANGRCPPQSTPGLGSWIANQRTRRARLPTERKARLDSLPWWAWDAYDAAWSTRLDELVAFYEANGRCPTRSAPGELGSWVTTQRTCRATMSAERKARLDGLPWWVWDPLDAAWSTKFDGLVAYQAEHARLPPQSTTGLGRWVCLQRLARGTMSAERKAKLEALGWWVWSVRAAPVIVGWDARFDELVASHAEHGGIPPRSAPGLGMWVITQRTCRATMSADRKARLEAHEWWVWDPLDSAWSTRFDELVAFYEANGRIPPQSTPGGLGKWVTKQRAKRETMEAERKTRLEALGWWVWDALDDSWSTKFDELVAFYQANGRLPPSATLGGLGAWVVTQRMRRATMSAARKAKLDSLGWWVWSVYAAPVLVGWDARFDELVAYHAEHGMGPARSAPGGLGTWVHTQRRSRAKMTPERKTRLEAMEWWVWDTLDDAWSTKFEELVAFYESNGRLPPSATPCLGNWVTTQRTCRATMSAERKARLEALGWWVWRAG
jgi:hypothetical protein